MTALAPAPILAPPSPGTGGPAQGPPFTGLTLDETRHLVERDDRGKWDVTVPRRHITARDGELEFPLDVGREDEMYERLAPTPHAFGQVCSRLGVPAAYLRKCPLVLRDQNLNWWLRAGAQDGAAADERWLLRARRGTLRAALSESYVPLDNALLLDVLLPALPRHYRVQWLGLSDETFHLRVTDPTGPRSPLPGDDFLAGVHVANSEVGSRSVSVDAVLYRLVCSNGLVATVQGKSLLRRRHVGVARPRLRAALEEAVSRAFGAADELMQRLRHASDVRVDAPDEAIDRLARTWGLPEQTAEIAKAALLSEPGAHQHTAYGIVNAFTNAAQTLPDDRRYDLEVLAGRLAENPERAFGLSPAERRAALLASVAGEEDIVSEEDIIAYAARTFGAEIMGRRPHAPAAGGRP